MCMPKRFPLYSAGTNTDGKFKWIYSVCILECIADLVYTHNLTRRHITGYSGRDSSSGCTEFLFLCSKRLTHTQHEETIRVCSQTVLVHQWTGCMTPHTSCTPSGAQSPHQTSHWEYPERALSSSRMYVFSHK